MDPLRPGCEAAARVRRRPPGPRPAGSITVQMVPPMAEHTAMGSIAIFGGSSVRDGDGEEAEACSGDGTRVRHGL